VRGACVELLAKSDSWAAKRAAFATKALWVARDADDDKRVWPAGRYVPQTQENPKDSVLSWCQGNESVDGEDIVVFLTTGINHIPRPEVQVSPRPGFFFTNFL
jgi:primary-amine oxidase